MRTQRNLHMIMLNHSITRYILNTFIPLLLSVSATKIMAQQVRRNDFILSGKIATTEITSLEINLFNTEAKLIKTEFPLT